MAELEGELRLDTSESESKIEALGTLFDSITSGFAQSLAEALDQLSNVPEPEIDTSGLTDSVATAIAEGGTEGAAAVQTAVETIDVPEVVVPVEADTSQAESDIEGLGDVAADAAVGVGDLSGATAGLNAASGLATGSAAGLGSAVEGLGGKAALAVGAFTAGAAVIATFFNEAVDAQGATEQFNATLGDAAAAVENLTGIEGLNTNLSDLALSLGSDDDKIRVVAARLFQLADASGIARADASLFTQQMIALGARAVALNPQLGDIGDVTDTLTRAFVRGGNSLAKLGLSISSNEIQTRALNDTNKETADQLTVVDKAMAGAAIASERYGANLAQVLAQGAENAIVTQRRLRQEIVETFEALGAPLVAPIFDTLDEAQPLVEDIGRVFAALALAILPAVEVALQALEPPLRAVATILELLAPALPILVGAFLAYKTAVLAAAAAELALAAATSVLVPGIIAFSAAFIITTKVLEQVFGKTKDLTDELENAESAITSIAHAADDQLVPSFNAAVKAQRELLREQGNATRQTIQQGAAIRVFTDLAKEDLGTASRLAEQYKGNAAVYAQFQVILARVAAAQSQANQDTERAAQLVRAQGEAVQALADSTSANVPTISSLISDFGSEIQQVFGEEAVPSIQSYVDRLNQSVADTAAWLDAITFLTASGLEGLASLVIDAGPEIGAGLIEQIRSAEPGLNQAWNDAIETATRAQEAGRARGEALGTAIATGLLTGAQAAVPGAEAVLTDVDVAIQSSQATLNATADQVGTSTADAFGSGVDGMTPETETALGSVAGVLDQSASILGSPARIAGLAIGSQLGEGIRDGLAIWDRFVAREAERIIEEAESAARRAAQSNSPSKLFADLGRDLGLGLAQGLAATAPQVAAASVRTVGAAVSTVDQSITIGQITNVGADPDARGQSLTRQLRSFQFLGGG